MTGLSKYHRGGVCVCVCVSVCEAYVLIFSPFIPTVSIAHIVQSQRMSELGEDSRYKLQRGNDFGYHLRWN